ncbi:MAG: Hsp20/alpha crystallin family protein [Candidatus Omnitrophica bacterium]|nr:Hsp20/alpha crystallin family protein [Candidatus Omnitrophota bacterium]
MKRTNVIKNSVIVLLGVLVCIPPVFAQDNAGDLKKQVEELQKRVDSLEAANFRLQNQAQQKITPQSSANTNNLNNRGWDMFDQTGRIQDELNLMFKSMFSDQKYSNPGMFSSSISFSPNLDIKENKDGYVVTFDMKGFDDQKVDMEINEHSITVKANQSKKDKKESKNGYYSSESYGSFLQTIPLPLDADTSKVKTEKKGEQLIIRLPKKTV